MKYYHILLIIIGFIVFFCILWIFITFLISRSGGWNQLAKNHVASSTPPEEKIIKNQLGKIGVARYKFSLHIAFTNEGLYLSVNKAFRLFHPPILLPWHKIKNVQKTSELMYKYVTMEIDGVRVSLAQEHYEEIMRRVSKREE